MSSRTTSFILNYHRRNIYLLYCFMKSNSNRFILKLEVAFKRCQIDRFHK